MPVGIFQVQPLLFAIVDATAAHLATINDLSFSPDGQYLATGSRDKSVKIWHADTLVLQKVLEGVRDRGHFNSVNAVHWTARGLLSAGDDRTIVWWTPTTQ